MTGLLAGSVADVCFDLVATPSVYGDEARLAGLVEERARSLGVRFERIGNAVVCRTGANAADGEPVALVGHLDTVRTGTAAASSARPTASSGAARRT